MLFANQEEKPVADEALASFEVDVTEQAELSQWDYEGGALTPCRKVHKVYIFIHTMMKRNVYWDAS